MAAIRALHPGDPEIVAQDHSDMVWLVAFTNDAGPVPFFLYDRQRREGRFLFDHQPELSRYELAPMEPFSYQARDGLTIHGYATFPPGAGRTGLPMVLNVHGGPWARDTWGFDAEAQWLANRGYLCVQVNFRGSTGYGKAFVNAGDREWGRAMQNDLTDGVAYAIAQGWADPERVAIFGGSYGGYAALAGVTFTPDLYRCAVDIVGPSNLKTLIETIPPYWQPQIALFHQRVGNPETDAEFLWSRSPLSRAASIKTPLLIAQGANDPRVKQAESEQIVAALRDAGIDHEYMLFPDEGHGFAKPENRLRFYAAAERFLARHLGGRAEDEPGVIEIKSDAAIDAMREAGRVVANALAAVRREAAVGVSLAELDEVAHEVLRKAGARSPFLNYHPSFAPTPFPAVICASVNDVIVHGIPDGYRLADGDLVSIDFGAELDGWTGDAAISFIVGTAGPGGRDSSSRPPRRRSRRASRPRPRGPASATSPTPSAPWPAAPGTASPRASAATASAATCTRTRTCPTRAGRAAGCGCGAAWSSRSSRC